MRGVCRKCRCLAESLESAITRAAAEGDLTPVESVEADRDLDELLAEKDLDPSGMCLGCASDRLCDQFERIDRRRRRAIARGESLEKQKAHNRSGEWFGWRSIQRPSDARRTH